MRLLVSVALACMSLSWAYGCGSDGDGSSAAGSGTSGDAPCTAPDQCPGTDEVCKRRSCVAGECGTELTPDGTTLPTDTVGDCKQRVCDGAGSVRFIMAEDPKSDGRQCTVDSCNPDGTTTFTPQAAGTECTEQAGRYCHASGDCLYCPPVTAACEDEGPGEPNATEEAAHDLGALVEGDAGVARLCGVLPGADVDWYTYLARTALDAAGRALVSESTIEVCKYLECTSGTTEVACPVGTTPATSPGGRAGCCDSGGFELADGDPCPEMDVDEVTVWVRVRSPGASASACAGYELELHP
jgi:hypothetical protein